MPENYLSCARGAAAEEIQGPNKSQKSVSSEDAKRYAADAPATLGNQKLGQQGAPAAVLTGRIYSLRFFAQGGMSPVLVTSKIVDLERGRLLGARSVMRGWTCLYTEKAFCTLRT